MLRMGYTTPWTSCNYWPESPIIKGLTVSQHSNIDQRVQHYGFHIGLTEVFQTIGITKVSHIIRKLKCYQYLIEKREIIIQHLDKKTMDCYWATFDKNKPNNKNFINKIMSHHRCNGLIYNLCNAPIIARHLIKKSDLIFDIFVGVNTSYIFFIRWDIIIRTLQRLYIKPL